MSILEQFENECIGCKHEMITVTEQEPDKYQITCANTNCYVARKISFLEVNDTVINAFWRSVYE